MKSHRVHLTIGQLWLGIGGPFQTLAAYVRLLHSRGLDINIVALSPPLGVESTGEAGGETVHYLRSGIALWPDLFCLAWRLRGDTVVIFGVWHPVFFANGLVMLLPKRLHPGRRILVPTQSLSQWDWSKHATVKRLLRPLVAFLLSRFDMVIFATRGEQQISTPTVAEARASVVYHPIAAVSTSQRDCGVFDECTIALMARIEEQKDLPLFLRTLACLPAHWRAEIIGDGDQRYVQRLKEYAESLGCASRITWHGWLSRDAAHERLAASEVLLVTSHAENYCHSAVEAMALSVPVVMVDRVAAAVDLEANGTGLVGASEPEGLADAVLTLHDQREMRQAIVEAGLEFAAARMDGRDAERLTALVTGS